MGKKIKFKKSKKFLPKRDKILIIVEGESDRIFINGLIKHLNLNSKFEVRTSASKDHCDILRKDKIKKLLKEAKDIDGFKQVYILIDFNTDCGDFKPSCVVELKNWYLKEIIDKKFKDYVKVIVALDELECWEILGWENKSYYSDCIDYFRKKLNIRNKTKIAQNSVVRIKKILDNCYLNSSLKYFLDRIGYSCQING